MIVVILTIHSLKINMMSRTLNIVGVFAFALMVQWTNAQCWKSVQTGANHSIALKNDGTLWAWGNNSSGELGNGGSSEQYSPYQVGSANDWKMVATGKSNTHNLAIKNDGSLWSWGYNFYGQLGYDAGVDYAYPVQVGTDTNWRMVACGMFYSLAIKTDGTLWGWGSNAFGQVNNNISSQFVLEPTVISAETHWANIVCGDAHNLALTTSGELYAWGFNLYGTVGNGSNTEASLVNIASDQTWLSIAAGDSHSLAVRSDQTLWSWGYGSNGQLGNGELYSTNNLPEQVGSDNNWSKVFSGEFFSFGIKTDKTLWAWGENGYGQLGIGNNEQQLSPIQVGTDNNWTEVQCGRQHTIGLKDDHHALTWGRNTFGTLGNGTYGGDGTGLHIYSNVPVDLSCGSVGIAETKDQKTFGLYPNPTNDLIYFSDMNPGISNPVEIYNLLGELVYSTILNRNYLDVNALVPGTYIIMVKSDFNKSWASFVKE